MNIRNIVERLEMYIISLIKGSSTSSRDNAIRVGLLLCSRIFNRIVEIRLKLYKERIFRHRTLGCFVVSIGNLTTGGTGKTPVVEVFSRTLEKNGRKVAILSRGYRNKRKSLKEKMQDLLFRWKEETPPRIVSDGKQLLLDSVMAGDEPYMLASNLKNVIVLVDKNRVKSGRYAIENFGADTLILDDGFQYLPLKPRLNILLIDATNPFDNHHLLPRGLLREPITNIQRADYIFLTKSSGKNHLRHLKQFIKKHNHRAEIIECTHRPLYLQDIYTKEMMHLSYMKGKKVASLSGIAAPESFEEFLQDFGSILVHTKRYADHHRYTQQEIIDFINAAKQNEAEFVIITEKDAVRFPFLDRRDLRIFFLRVEIDILTGYDNFNECISRICFSQPRAENTVLFHS